MKGGASIRTRNDGSMVPRSLETLGSINTLGKAVGLTGAFSGHIFGLGAAAAAVADVATATAVFSWPPAAAAAVSLSAAGGRLLLVVSFLTGVVLGVIGSRSGLEQRNKFFTPFACLSLQHRQCCESGFIESGFIESGSGYGSGSSISSKSKSGSGPDPIRTQGFDD